MRVVLKDNSVPDIKGAGRLWYFFELLKVSSVFSSVTARFEILFPRPSKEVLFSKTRLSVGKIS
jgi:hypothetical protein